MPPTFVRRSIFAAVLFPLGIRPVRAAATDPIFAVIDRAQATDDELAALLSNLNEDDEEAVRLADEAADRADAAFNALRDTRPTTAGGFRTLVAFYAQQAELNEPHCCGGLYLRHVLAALPEASA